jgi:hypothetical protein
MTPPTEPPAGRRPSLDEVAAERLLHGQRPSAGASTDEQVLSDLLAAVSAPPSARELSGEARAVAAFAATRPATTGPRHARRVIRRHRPALRPRVSHGIAAAAALGALTLGGVAAAAYTGSLPSSVQRLAHEHIGAPPQDRPHSRPVSTHRSHTRPASTALRASRPAIGGGKPGLSAVTPRPSASRSSPRAAPPSLSPSATDQRVALCTAYAQAWVSKDDKAVADAFRKLVPAAGGHDKVFAYCDPVWRSIPGAPRNDDQQNYPGPRPTAGHASSKERPSH